MGAAEEGQDGQLAGHRSTATGKRFSTAASGTGTPAREDSRAKKQREHRGRSIDCILRGLTLQKSLRLSVAGCHWRAGAGDVRSSKQQQHAPSY